jgi:Cys-rich repeat protein
MSSTTKMSSHRCVSAVDWLERECRAPDRPGAGKRFRSVPRFGRHPFLSRRLRTVPGRVDARHPPSVKSLPSTAPAKPTGRMAPRTSPATAWERSCNPNSQSISGLPTPRRINNGSGHVSTFREGRRWAATCTRSSSSTRIATLPPGVRASRPKFTGDPTPGGYEHVVEVLGNGTGLQLWNWQGNMYVQGQLPASRATGEGGTDTDPIRIGASTHGYTQVAIELGVVSLTQACDANLYFRTTNDSAALGAGDLDVGQLGSCVPGLDGNGVPGVLVPPNGCRSNAECPAGAVCQNGQCAFASACTTNADCAQGMQCTADGRCVPAPNGTCTSNAQCNGLICQGGQCAACPLGGNQCGAGYTCGADGRCSAGSGTGPTGEAPLVLAPGEEIKGGACNCALSVRSTPAGVSEFCLAVVAFFVTRRRAARDG